MRRARRANGGGGLGRAVAATGAALLGLACGERAVETAPTAPPAPRASFVLEPKRPGVGDVAVLELAVTTPPGHAPRPLAAPESTPGFWLLGSETPEVDKRPGRWLHRTRLRLRAREVGRFEWDPPRIEVEAPDGSVAVLTMEPPTLEVASVREDFPERETPFGARAPPETRTSTAALLAAALAGAVSALAAVALVRRARRRPAPAPAREAPTAPPWEQARAALAEARARCERDPHAAAHAASRALRRYVSRRFGADATARTTEELAANAPPFGARSRWPDLLAILEPLDRLRFPQRPAERDLARRVAELLDEAETFVAESLPPEGLR